MKRLLGAGLLALLMLMASATWSGHAQVTKITKPINSKKFTIIKINRSIEPLDVSVKKADLIAMVQIIDKVSGVKEPYQGTIFSTKVLKIYKGQDKLLNMNQINIIQSGNSALCVNGYPLFQKSEKMILIMKKASGYANTYQVLFQEVNTFKIADIGFMSIVIKQAGIDNSLKDIELAGTGYDQITKGKMFLLDKQGKKYQDNKKLQLFDLVTLENRLGNLINPPYNTKFIVKDNVRDIDEGLVKASDKFGIGIFNTEIKRDTNKNIIISPLSLFTAFSVVLNGANGETAAQMKEVMNVKDYTGSKLNEGMNNIINILNDNQKFGEPGFKNIYNSLWIDKGFELKSSFINKAESYYNSDVFKEDLTSSNAIKSMNQWIGDRSGGLIKNPINNIEKGTKLNIFNVLHFVGKWTNPFNKANTNKEIFTTTGGTSVNVDMMNEQREISYYEDERAKVGVFSYYNGSMMFILPKGDINDYGATLNYDELSKFNKEVKMFITKVKVPKLNLEYKSNLNNTLIDMGMKLPFDSINANFDNMKNNNDPLWIGSVMHNCVVKLDEEGTEAAALTSVSLCGAAKLPDEIKEFYLNKPFIFVIQDSRNLALFVGKVVDPTLK